MHSPNRKTKIAAGADPLKAAVVLALLGVTLMICRLAPPVKAVGETGVVMELPYVVGPLVAFSENISQAELDILPKDTTFARKAYGLPDSAPIQRITCSIVLSGREKRSIHRPERCLPGQGWRIDESRIVDVPLASGHDLKVTALLLERPEALSNGQPYRLQSYFLYWFVAKGVTTSSQLHRILLTNWDMLFHRVNRRWAYVIVQGNILQGLGPHGLSPDQTLEVLKKFIHDSAPYYMKSEMAAPPVSYERQSTRPFQWKVGRVTDSSTRWRGLSGV
jgi:hypothetical protein